MIPVKTGARRGGISKIIVPIVAIIFLLGAIAWFVFYLKDEKDITLLRARFESIRSVHQIDAFIEDLDRFEKNFSVRTKKKELKKVRSYLARIKDGISLQLIIDSASTTACFDGGSENDIFVVVSGPILGTKVTPVIEDNNNPTFNFPVDFLWAIDCKPFIFDVNDNDVTNFERISTITVPCGGITGWRQLDKKEIKGFNDTTLRIYLTEVPDCPW